MTENGYPIRLGHGLFETATEVTYRHSGRREDFASFPFPFDKLPKHMVSPHTIMLAELFKIVSGQIREIEAMMVNVPLGASCGWGQ